MIPLRLAWTLLTVSAWTFGSSQILQEPVKVLYPAIASNEAIECECRNISCDAVFWFRTLPSRGIVEFIGKCNNADRVNWGLVDQKHFKLSKRSSSSTFVLRILQVTEEDTGIYSCVLKDSRSSKEVFIPGTALWPGVTPPTPPPPPKKTPHIPKPSSCTSKNTQKDGCHSLVLWPLVGLTAGLSVGLLCTLYYFSRLPKKCPHHFMKKRQMT